jgi:hypothetical protein
MSRYPSDSYMQKPMGKGMWEVQDQDGWTKLTQNGNKNVAEKSFRQRRMEEAPDGSQVCA